MHDSAVDIVQLNSNGKVDANGGAANQSALPFSQLYMTFEHGALAVMRTLMLFATALLKSPSGKRCAPRCGLLWSANIPGTHGQARASSVHKSLVSHGAVMTQDGVALTVGIWPAVYYSVDLPGGADEPPNQRPEDAGRLSILNDVSGAFRPNILTAFMGETGAGKTTLLDVLADRKTGGKIEGDIRINVRRANTCLPCHWRRRRLRPCSSLLPTCAVLSMVGNCRVTPRWQPRSPVSVATWSRQTSTRLRSGRLQSQIQLFII